MAEIQLINYTLPYGNREVIRKNLIQLFLNEKPGTGRGENSSRYRYNVESFDKYIIFLRRPTQLNKGFDFTVNIEGLYFKKKRKYSCPSHNDIFDALSECKNNFPSTYPLIKEYINDLFHCKEQKFVEFNIFFSDYEGNKHPIEIILLALKWLFIEQDCAYWNYSGRKVLFNELINLDLA